MLCTIINVSCNHTFPCAYGQHARCTFLLFVYVHSYALPAHRHCSICEKASSKTKSGITQLQQSNEDWSVQSETTLALNLQALTRNKARQSAYWTGRTLCYIEKKVKDHHHIRLYEPEQSVVVEHNNDSGAVLTYTSILAWKPGRNDRFIKEAIDIELHPTNTKLEDGFSPINCPSP